MSNAFNNAAKLARTEVPASGTSAAVTAAIADDKPLHLSPGAHAVVSVPSQVSTLSAAIEAVKAWSAPPGSSITIEVTSGFSLPAGGGFTHPDGSRVTIIDLTQAVGSDGLSASYLADLDAIRNGATVIEAANVPVYPAAGASTTTALTKVKHAFSYAERIGYFAATGESIDAFSLPAGVYRTAGTELGVWPLLSTAQKAGLLIVPGLTEGRTQWFFSDGGYAFRRVWTRTDGAPVWGSWKAWTDTPIDNGDGNTLGAFDWNDLTDTGWYRRNSNSEGTSNGPTTNFVGLIEVVANNDRSYIIQRAHQVPAQTSIFIRTYSSSSWSVWRTWTGA